ncbi:unknown [Clostridium sp. CAG:921]|nr:unknown [Clostridium sp. CAG:921]
MAPVASEYPNPHIGTVAPALPNSTIGPYTPIAVSIAPRVTNITNILAGVNLVLSINIWPIAQIIPPVTKTFKYSINISIGYTSFSIATA